MNSEFNEVENVSSTHKTKYSQKKDLHSDMDSPYNNLFFHNFEQVLIEYIKNNMDLEDS